MANQIRQRLAGVENVIQEKNVSAPDIRKQLGLDVEKARFGRGPSITGGLDQTDPQRQIQPANQIGQEHQAAGEDAEDGNRLILKSVADFTCQLAHTLL